MKFLLAKNCKPCEIYRKICNVSREAGFNLKKNINEPNTGFPLQTYVKKTIPEIKTYQFSGKKVLGLVVSKEGLTESIL